MSRLLGENLQTSLDAAIHQQFYGEVPPGSAIVLETTHGDRTLIVIFVCLGSTDPADFAPNYVYAALRGAFLAIDRHNEAALDTGQPSPIGSVGVPLFPAFGPLAGLELPHREIARQMALAFDTTPAYVFSSLEASKNRPRTKLSRREQQRRRQAQSLRTNAQVEKASSKALARSIRRGALSDFCKPLQNSSLSALTRAQTCEDSRLRQKSPNWRTWRTSRLREQVARRTFAPHKRCA